MTDMNSAWNVGGPEWAKPVLDALTSLDASDASPGEGYDGFYMGHDLVEMARLYTERFSSHHQGMLNVFQATATLDDYARGVGSAEAKEAASVIADALFAGVCSILEGKKPDSREVPGLSSKFIPEEVDSVFKHYIVEGNGLRYGGWQGFWKTWLDGCRTDLFLTRESCPF